MPAAWHRHAAARSAAGHGGRTRRAGVPRGAHRQRARHRDVRRTVSTSSGCARSYYHPSGADAYTMRRPAAAASRRRQAVVMIVMGIESSCDETGVGIVRLAFRRLRRTARRRGRLQRRPARPLRWRGARDRLTRPPRGDRARDASRPGAAGIGKPDALAVTIGPGLAGALLVGVAAAKAYAAAWDVPFYAVNHLGGHVAVDTLEHGPMPPARGAARLRRTHASAAGRRSGRADHRARQHGRRCRGGGVRQGGASARPRLSRRARPRRCRRLGRRDARSPSLAG